MRILAGFSVFHGLLLLVAEVARNAGGAQWWPFWLVDLVAAGLILAGGSLILMRGDLRSRLLLSTGWGFAGAMNWMSFASHLDENLRANGQIEPITYAAGFGLVVSVLCMFLSLTLLARGSSHERGVDRIEEAAA